MFLLCFFFKLQAMSKAKKRCFGECKCRDRKYSSSRTKVAALGISFVNYVKQTGTNFKTNNAPKRTN